MSITANYRPSKKPKVSQVHNWVRIYEDSFANCSWKYDLPSSITVWNGYPFPDFYKVVFRVGEKKVTKYFYGEMAYHQVRSYCADRGFTQAYHSF